MVESGLNERAKEKTEESRPAATDAILLSGAYVINFSS